MNVLRFALCATLPLLFSSLCVAAEPERDSAQTLKAKQLTDEALYHEVYGDCKTKEQLLKQAVEVDPEYAPARWHQGYVKHKNDWVKAGDFVAKVQADPVNKRYRELKNKQEINNASGQLNAANWCNKQRLHDRERGHLESVLDFEPNNVEARKRLGHIFLQGEWMSIEEAEKKLKKTADDQRNLQEWHPVLAKIAEQLTDKNAAVRKRGRDALAAIKLPTAILPIELILCNKTVEITELAIKTISEIPNREAAESLARIAVFSPSEDSRQLAAVKLRDYEKLMYVPMLLSGMRTPITNVRWTAPDANGRLQYRHVLFNETMQDKRVSIKDTEYRRVALNGGNRQESAQRAIEMMDETISDTNFSTAVRNEEAQELNQAISEALQIATLQQLDDDPRAWWAWWDKQVGVESYSKDLVVDQETELVDIVDEVPSLQAPSQGIVGLIPTGRQRSGNSGECLVAGTPIMTACGMRSVEKISAGDLVLSKDSITGELAFKPVLRTTERPRSALIEIKFGDQTIECSAGHPFWVSGKGWVMAQNITPGMSLHSNENVVIVDSVTKEGSAVTYNMVVGDFHTYFVGPSQILSHDFTMRESIPTIVPGLKK